MDAAFSEDGADVQAPSSRVAAAAVAANESRAGWERFTLSVSSVSKTGWQGRARTNETVYGFPQVIHRRCQPKRFGLSPIFYFGCPRIMTRVSFDGLQLQRGLNAQQLPSAVAGGSCCVLGLILRRRLALLRLLNLVGRLNLVSRFSRRVDLVRVLAFQRSTLDVDVRQDLVQPLRQPPGFVPGQMHQRWNQ